MKIIKRDGRIVEYNRQKIENAILHANNDVSENNRANKRQIENIIKHIEELNKKRMLVEDIQDIIETELMKIKKYDLAKAYIIYRYKRALVRKSNITDESILSLIKSNNYENEFEEKKELVSIQRDLIASEVSKDLTKRVLLPEKISEAHKNGVLYFHDAEYFLQPLINSCILNYKDILDNEIIINENKLAKPTDFIEACNVLSQIIFNISLSQYGEQSINIKYLSKYLELSQKKYRFDDELLRNHLENGIKIIMYQLNNLLLLRDKSPITTLFLELDDNEYNELIIDEILNQYAIIFKESKLLPKIMYLLDNNNINKNNKYYYLTEKVIKIIKNKLPITFISSKMLKQNYNCIFSPMGDYQLFQLFKDKNNELVFEGRFNQGIVSINLPQIGLEANSNEDIFWNLLDERLDLCFEALMCRYYSLLGTLSNTSPLHWQNGAIYKFNKNEKIDSLLKNNFSTLSLGYIGLNEITQIIKNETIIEKNGEKFAIKLLKYIRSKCDSWKKETGIGFVLYGIPSKTLGTYFLNIDKEKFGIVKNVTDKECYNISHNIEENNEISIFDKIKILSQFQNICSGGDISFIKINEEITEEIIEFIYNNIQCINLY